MTVTVTHTRCSLVNAMLQTMVEDCLCRLSFVHQGALWLYHCTCQFAQTKTESQNAWTGCQRASVDLECRYNKPVCYTTLAPALNHVTGNGNAKQHTVSVRPTTQHTRLTALTRMCTCCQKSKQTISYCHVCSHSTVQLLLNNPTARLSTGLDKLIPDMCRNSLQQARLMRLTNSL